MPHIHSMAVGALAAEACQHSKGDRKRSTTSIPFTPVCHIILCLLLVACGGDGPGPDPNNTTCGDGVCDPADGETMDTCLKDCSGRCDLAPGFPVFCWDPRGTPS